MLYTSVHALRHGYSRFTWFLDMHFLLRENICWDSLLAKAQDYNLQRLWCTNRLPEGYPVVPGSQQFTSTL